MQNRGKIYIASMVMRGDWAPRPIGSKVINVTSMQKKSSQFRIDFSPMHLEEYKGYACFENYWQGGKVYEGIDPEVSHFWWLKQITGKRKYPAGKGHRVLYGIYEDNVARDYLSARKNIYVKNYFELVKDRNSIDICRQYLDNGIDITIYDFDGPKTESGEITCLELDDTVLGDKLNDTSYPFGHGYVVGAILLGLSVEELLAL